MNNPVFGETTENVKKHREYQTCNIRPKKKLFSITTKT